VAAVGPDAGLDDEAQAALTVAGEREPADAVAQLVDGLRVGQDLGVRRGRVVRVQAA
jgi:hypothetical protein